MGAYNKSNSALSRTVFFVFMLCLIAGLSSSLVFAQNYFNPLDPTLSNPSCGVLTVNAGYDWSASSAASYSAQIAGPVSQSYAFSAGGTSHDFTGLPDGLYQITVTVATSDGQKQYGGVQLVAGCASSVTPPSYPNYTSPTQNDTTYPNYTYTAYASSNAYIASSFDYFSPSIVTPISSCNAISVLSGWDTAGDSSLGIGNIYSMTISGPNAPSGSIPFSGPNQVATVSGLQGNSQYVITVSAKTVSGIKMVVLPAVTTPACASSAPASGSISLNTPSPSCDSVTVSGTASNVAQVGLYISSPSLSSSHSYPLISSSSGSFSQAFTKSGTIYGQPGLSYTVTATPYDSAGQEIPNQRKTVSFSAPLSCGTSTGSLSSSVSCNGASAFVSWSDSSAPYGTYYRITRTVAGSSTLLGTYSSTSSVTDSHNLPSGTSYSYLIQRLDNNLQPSSISATTGSCTVSGSASSAPTAYPGVSSTSSPVPVYAEGSFAPSRPQAPAGNVNMFTSTCNAIILNWAAPSSGSVTSYRIDRYVSDSSQSSGWRFADSVAGISPSTFSYSYPVPSASISQPYFFNIFAFNSNGAESHSVPAQVMAASQSSSSCSQTPSQSSGSFSLSLSGVPSCNSAYLTWSLPSGAIQGSTAYTVSLVNGGSNSVSTSNNYYTFSNLNPNTAYTAYVSAIVNGVTQTSNWQQFTTGSNVGGYCNSGSIGASPTSSSGTGASINGLTGTISGCNVNLLWNPSGASSYKTSWNVQGGAITEGQQLSQTSYSMSVIPGATYNFYVTPYSGSSAGQAQQILCNIPSTCTSGTTAICGTSSTGSNTGSSGAVSGSWVAVPTFSSSCNSVTITQGLASGAQYYDAQIISGPNYIGTLQPFYNGVATFSGLSTGSSYTIQVNARAYQGASPVATYTYTIYPNCNGQIGSGSYGFSVVPVAAPLCTGVFITPGAYPGAAYTEGQILDSSGVNVIQTQPLTGAGFQFNGLSLNSNSYYWRVNAKSSSGSIIATYPAQLISAQSSCGGSSSTGSFTTVPTLTPSCNSISVTQGVAASAATYNAVLYDSSGNTLLQGAQIFNSASSTISFSGLSSSTSYLVKVNGLSSSGATVAVQSIPVTTSSCGTTTGSFTTAPIASATCSSVIVSMPSASGATSYTAQLLQGSSLVGSPQVFSGSPITFSGVSGNTAYTVSVTALSSSGSSVATQSLPITTLSSCNGATTTGSFTTSSSPSATCNSVTVTKPSASGATSYTAQLLRAGSPVGPLQVFTDSNLVFTSGVSLGTAYTISISALNAQGASVATQSFPITTATSCTGGSSLSVQCSNSIRDGAETDIDCGGGCATLCAVGKVCTFSGDCQSNFCNPSSHVCATPTCFDGVKDGDESDVDCGSLCPNKCQNGKYCSVSSDCSSDTCRGGQCTTSSSSSGNSQGGVINAISTSSVSDKDYDSVPDSSDNCPTDVNPTQTDSDNDGTGDACDSTKYGDEEKTTIPSTSTSAASASSSTSGTDGSSAKKGKGFVGFLLVVLLAIVIFAILVLVAIWYRARNSKSRAHPAPKQFMPQSGHESASSYSNQSKPASSHSPRHVSSRSDSKAQHHRDIFSAFDLDASEKNTAHEASKPAHLQSFSAQRQSQSRMDDPFKALADMTSSLKSTVSSSFETDYSLKNKSDSNKKVSQKLNGNKKSRSNKEN